MEVDYSASDEHKETSGGALLPAGEPTGGSFGDRPMQIDQGQWAISGRCQTLSKLRPVVIDAPVCTLSLCVQVPRGFPWVPVRESTPADGLPASSAALDSTR
jgi:hypothetical protein